jgi:Tfp pilus assembly protein PilF
LALLVWTPSLMGGFLYDDLHVVVENPHIRDLGSLGTVLRYEPARPLLGLVWALNYAVGGLRPWTYHLVNVLIHAANAALVGSLFLWMARRRGTPSAPAIFGACLFAVTPMAAETVAYVASRSTALCALFVLGSLRIGADVLVRRSGTRLALALLLAVLALATKEEALVLPLLLMLIDYFFVAGQRATAVWARARIHLAFWALPLVGLLARRLATGTWLPGQIVPNGRYALTQAAAFPLYFVRALIPLDPALYREHPVARWPPDLPTAVGVLASGALLIVAFRARRRWPSWAFAVFWMVAALLPSSSIVALNEMVVDHRAYLGGVAVLHASALSLWQAGGRRLAAVLVVALAARAVHYEWILADPVRIWEQTVRRAPRSAAARLNLSEAYLARGDPRAESALLSAISLAPADLRLWTNLGALYAQQGRLLDAEGAMRRAALLAPGDAHIRNNLGLILGALGRDDQAVQELQAAIAADPGLAQPHIHLAALLARQGDREGARVELERAMKLQIDEEDARAIEAVRAQLR